jgi:hypothetical protein
MAGEKVTDLAVFALGKVDEAVLGRLDEFAKVVDERHLDSVLYLHSDGESVRSDAAAVALVAARGSEGARLAPIADQKPRLSFRICEW